MSTSTPIPGTSAREPSSIDVTANRVHRVVDRAAAMAAPVAEQAANTAHSAIDKVADVATPTAAWIADSRVRLATGSRALTETCGKYVRDRPLTTVAGAVAIGYLIGKLTR
ncbi:MAG: hypothetical protein ACM338_04470 [Betaproteobacteria bacterium]